MSQSEPNLPADWINPNWEWPDSPVAPKLGYTLHSQSEVNRAAGTNRALYQLERRRWGPREADRRYFARMASLRTDAAAAGFDTDIVTNDAHWWPALREGKHPA